MAGIFISYRREDSAGHAGRLYDRLVRDFRGDEVFMDVERIASGEDFPRMIEGTVQKSDVFLVVIGRRWLTAADQYGQRRLDKGNDWVRMEIGAALTRNVRVIPLLMDDAALPSTEALPGDLVRLTSLQAHPIHHLTFHQDVDRLVDRIKEAIGKRRTALANLHEAGAIRVHPQDSLKYVWVPPGSFLMGRVAGDNVEAQRYLIEKPQHPVRLTRGFWITRGPVTARAYRYFVTMRGLDMPRAPNYNPGWMNHDHPVVYVTWTQAREYCAWVGGRLPTEAQWEYAGRGGIADTIYPWGNEADPNKANFIANPKWGRHGTSPVGTFPANGFGLYDVVGNVWEWVSDWYDDEAYLSRRPHEPTVDPEAFVNKLDRRVVRGGSWGSIAEEIRLSLRGFQTPAAGFEDFGFRCLIDEMPEEPAPAEG